jgi:hypothetical protein
MRRIAASVDRLDEPVLNRVRSPSGIDKQRNEPQFRMSRPLGSRLVAQGSTLAFFRTNTEFCPPNPKLLVIA